MKKIVEKSEFISDMEKAVKEAKVKSIFGTELLALEKVCVSFLKSRGYSIFEPYNYRKKGVRNISDLIELFYYKYYELYGDNVIRNDPGNDLAAAKRFVDHRMKAFSLDKSTALNECAEIILQVFDNFEELSIDFLNFTLFGSEKFYWLVDNAIDLNRRRLDEFEQIKIQRFVDENIHKVEDEYVFGFEDLIDNFIKESSDNGKEKE